MAHSRRRRRAAVNARRLKHDDRARGCEKRLRTRALGHGARDGRLRVPPPPTARERGDVAVVVAEEHGERPIVRRHAVEVDERLHSGCKIVLVPAATRGGTGPRDGGERVDGHAGPAQLRGRPLPQDRVALEAEHEREAVRPLPREPGRAERAVVAALAALVAEAQEFLNFPACRCGHRRVPVAVDDGVRRAGRREVHVCRSTLAQVKCRHKP
ncbi:MAG: hypothetical protein CMM37_00190 [Rhodospirillaceae bacterium]|nr:hypothetical protein [Rhodospirillaceae bacterium]